MGNVLPLDVIGQLRKLLAEGRSQREIARTLGIAPGTVRRYVTNRERLCECGQPSGHKGWCKVRYAKSTARQAFHARRRGVFIEVPQIETKSRVSDAVKRKRYILGIGPWRAEPLPWREHYGAVGDVYHATRKVRHDLREDVRSAMLVAVLDGRLPRPEIPNWVSLFITHELQAMSGGFFISPLTYGGRFL